MPGMSRLAYGIWASRIDLQGTFPSLRVPVDRPSPTGSTPAESPKGM